MDIANTKLKKIDKTSKTSVNLNNRIIVIDSADPGFDWIFTNKIRGLMTKYGGVSAILKHKTTAKMPFDGIDILIKIG